MENKSIKIGKDKSTNDAISIEMALNGLGCNCVCFDCGQPLVAANNGKKQEHHFKHFGTYNCSGGQETALHKLGKQIIGESNHFHLSKYGKIEYNNALLEEKFEKITPDATIQSDKHGQIFIEVKVTHPIEEEKKVFYKNHKCIEIDLTKYTYFDYESLKNYIIEELGCKEIIAWYIPEEILSTVEVTGIPALVYKKSYDWFNLIITVIVTFLLLYFGWLLLNKGDVFSNKKRKYRKANYKRSRNPYYPLMRYSL